MEPGLYLFFWHIFCSGVIVTAIIVDDILKKH